MARKTSSEIDQEAAEWAALADKGSMSPEVERDLQAWFATDDRCLGAYGRMLALLWKTQNLKTVAPNFAQPEDTVRPNRRLLLQAAGAVGVMTVIGGAAVWKYLDHTADFQTRKGEKKVLALADGSVVTLNTQSQMEVDFSGKGRSVELLEGEALFKVARNDAHPFTIDVGTFKVRVIGTSFTVKKLPDIPIEILVREGVVEVSKPDQSVAPVRLPAYTKITAASGGGRLAVTRVTPLELMREFAWQDGKIAFEGETLGQAAAEFERYSDTKVVIENDQLAHEQIAGLFNADDPVGFAQNIAASLNARTVVREGEVRIFR